ncbi:tagaturonate reductase [Uliginosibacterium sp. 31-12]|uniref:tagaturonate reductase n=1 Tax=Uliginosibacterium sp. 31-12 TaxID=3062781 RepID=UPI0026E38F12|nr:tagaturonate reductase [Uliginosibacterium sp. 31-12]MDO6386938.1 tagaturonate reductase [Uliginosibacterium sp. 31-12]
MLALNRSTLATTQVRAEYSLDAAAGKPPVKILQIGDGNFLRGFADWLIDIANGAGHFNGRVTIAQPLARGIADLINAQDGLYTVLLRGVQGGQTFESRRIVSCVDKCLNPYAQWDEMLALAADPALRFVISNTTEAGIAYVAEAQGAACPDNFPAKIAALLWARYQVLGGTAASGLVFLPCELIEANGTKLRATVLQHVEAWGLPAAFAEWIKAHNHFCNTLVDRIVPGYPAAEAAKLCEELGYEDKLLVAAEPFLLWVIEGPAHLADEIPLHKAGLGVVWTDDMQPYRTRKVRILNGAHTASSLASYSTGLDTVQQMTEDPVVSKYLKQVMFEEIVPFVPLPDAERRAYADTIMERFANPHIRHELISIALNSVSKWQVRVLPTVKDYVAAHGKAPAGLSFSLAALLNFYQGTFDAKGEFVGQRDAGSYPIRDNAEILSALGEAWRGWQAGEDLAGRVRSMLGDARLWGEDLNAVAGLTEQVTRALTAIKAQGVKAAMANL